jgi:hypothetical protein
MKRWLILLMAVGTTALAAGAGLAQAERAAPPIVVTFQKHVVDPTNLIFAGTAGGAVDGTLMSRMVPGSLTIDGAIWHFTFDWIVGAKPRHESFVARTTGTFDTSTGRVVMDGRVTVGWHKGAAVHEEGQLLDPATYTFAGRLEIARGDD